ncbi:MAG: peroxidase-related enzyme [Candidatus Izemoplasmatales bacterium]
MSWIKEVKKEDNLELKKIYEAAENRTGEETANVLKVHSLKPKTLQAHMMLYETLMFGQSELSRQQREMIGVVVSRANSCPYCVSHHGEAMALISNDSALMQKLADDYQKADLKPQDLTICKYSEKLTKTPYKMIEKDIEDLRQVGLSDEAIFDVNQIVAYFNYVNRIVHGLGVDLEKKDD